MTENAFYPLFVLASLVARADARAADARCGRCCCSRSAASAFATRAQAIALVRRRARRAAAARPDRARSAARGCGASRRSTAIAGGAAVLALLGTVARGRSPLSLLGAYRAATDSDYSARTDRCTTSLARRRARPLPRRDRPFAALLAMWLAPRTLDARGARVRRRVAADHRAARGRGRGLRVDASPCRIEERNDFYVAPLALIALLGLAARRRRPARARRVLAGRRGRRRRAAGRRPVRPLRQHVGGLGHVRRCCPGGGCRITGSTSARCASSRSRVGLAAAALFVFVPRRFALALPALVAAYFVLASLVVENGRHGIRQASVGALCAGIRVAAPGLDRPRGRPRRRRSRSSGTTRARRGRSGRTSSSTAASHDVYTVDGPDPADGGLPETPVRRARRRHARHRGARRVRACATRSRTSTSPGTPLARDPARPDALPRRRPDRRPDARDAASIRDTWSRPRGHLPARALHRRHRCPCASAPTSTSSTSAQT